MSSQSETCLVLGLRVIRGVANPNFQLQNVGLSAIEVAKSHLSLTPSSEGQFGGHMASFYFGGEGGISALGLADASRHALSRILCRKWLRAAAPHIPCAGSGNNLA
jgi:hypothetical protein